MAGTIVFNGKTYHSIDEMPPEVREAYEQIMSAFVDKKQNGMPDVFEGLLSTNTNDLNIQSRSSTIIYDGKKYDSVDQLPPEARQKYDQAMGKLDADKNGIPDFVESLVGMPPATSHTLQQAQQDTSSLTPSQPVFPSSTAVPVNSQSAIEPEDNSLRWLIIGIGLVLVLCLAAIGVWFLFGR
jgi:hypothetical protein